VVDVAIPDVLRATTDVRVDDAGGVGNAMTEAISRRLMRAPFVTCGMVAVVDWFLCGLFLEVGEGLPVVVFCVRRGYGSTPVVLGCVIFLKTMGVPQVVFCVYSSMCRREYRSTPVVFLCVFLGGCGFAPGSVFVFVVCGGKSAEVLWLSVYVCVYV
jgi:hypothetical protein